MHRYGNGDLSFWCLPPLLAVVIVNFFAVAFVVLFSLLLRLARDFDLLAEFLNRGVARGGVAVQAITNDPAQRLGNISVNIQPGIARFRWGTNAGGAR